jgi:hypothetical protein
MNRNAKYLYRHGQTAINNGASFAAKSFEKYKGKSCPTGFNEKASNPDNRRKSARGERTVKRESKE